MCAVADSNAWLEILGTDPWVMDGGEKAEAIGGLRAEWRGREDPRLEATDEVSDVSDLRASHQGGYDEGAYVAGASDEVRIGPDVRAGADQASHDYDLGPGMDDEGSHDFDLGPGMDDEEPLPPEEPEPDPEEPRDPETRDRGHERHRGDRELDPKPEPPLEPGAQLETDDGSSDVVAQGHELDEIVYEEPSPDDIDTEWDESEPEPEPEEQEGVVSEVGDGPSDIVAG